MPRVVVLGSLTLDIFFRMPRFPAPGETLFADSTAVFPGGKGLNQGIAAARLGAEVTLIGRVGTDSAGDQLIAAAEAAGLDSSFIVRDPDYPSGMAVPVVVPGGNNSILASGGANLRMRLSDIAAAADRIRAADVLLLQFEAPAEVIEFAIRLAAGAGVRVILNPAPVREFDRALLRRVSVLVVNEVEGAMLLSGVKGPGEQATALRNLGPETVIVTLGPEGGLFADPSGVTRFAAMPVAVVDTVGAGDAFCGALGAAIASGETMAAAVRFANASAAISVTRAGAAPALPSLDEVSALLAIAPAGGAATGTGG